MECAGMLEAGSEKTYNSCALVADTSKQPVKTTNMILYIDVNIEARSGNC
jgi:hypothetical protein